MTPFLLRPSCRNVCSTCNPLRTPRLLLLQRPSRRSSRIRRGFADSKSPKSDGTDESNSHPVQDINSGNSYTQPAENLSQSVTPAEEQDYDERIAATSKSKQIRTPWQREGAALPPVSRSRSAGAMTKGKLLTTPSRMLKMVLPLTTRDFNSDRKDVEPLALLVHPQQPLSYLERLIQSELPMMKDEEGKDKIPNVWFRAEDSMRDQGANTGGEDAAEDKEDSKRRKGDKTRKENKEDEEAKDLEDEDTTMIDGESVKTGKISPQKQRHSPEKSAALRGGHGEGGVESYSGLGQDAKPRPKSEEDDSSKSPGTDADRAASFVRWSSSTEIGNFIREAARARYFAVEIEGAPHPILVGAPSFRDRTYYVRMRLRQRSREIASMADVKRECDQLAEKGAKRVAWAGGTALVGYWWVVYVATFRSDLGWDVMEPVTYLVGLLTLIGGYGWFLVHNRQVSYRSAMNFTISRRQSKLYEKKGFDLGHWEDLIDEGNKLRREIKAIAEEYDVTWNEKEDAQNQQVVEELAKDRKRKGQDGGNGKKGEDSEDD